MLVGNNINYKLIFQIHWATTVRCNKELASDLNWEDFRPVDWASGSFEMMPMRQLWTEDKSDDLPV